jgi:integrase
MAKLDDIKLKQWIKAGLAVAGKSDGGGLSFTLSAKGTATWVYRYRYAGKARELTLGNYPTISLKRARQLATEARAKVQQGVDVATAKREALAVLSAAGTVKELCDEYYTRTILGRVTRPDIVRERLDNDLIRRLGRMRITDVKPMDIDGMIKAIVDRGSPVMANRVLATTKAVFDYGIRRHWIEQNPAAAFRRADAGGEEKARTRSLSDDELVKLFQAIRDVGPNFRIYDLIVKLLLVTAVRISELIEAPWAEFDLDADDPVWCLPATRVKKGKNIWKRDLTIPLSPVAVEWLREIKRTSVASDYVFPARRRGKLKRPMMSPATLNWAFDKLEHNLEHFTPHDMRRTARTHLSALHVAPHVAERCLNHKLPGINDTYDTFDYLDERRLGLNAWADLLVQLDKGRVGKVIPINRKTVT